ncbi:MAG: sugar-binding protein, partial [Victivallaceae bacterium]|nr:sugar-binding protein [Victivallaceae bacterium]
AYRIVLEKFEFEVADNGSYDLIIKLKNKRSDKILDELHCKIYAIAGGHFQGEIKDSFWGIRGPALDVDLTWMMGIKWMMAEVAWPWVEPEKGEDCFKVVDYGIQRYKDAGFYVMPVLNKTAPWARRKDVPQNSELTPPRDLREWGSYVYKTISRYKDEYWSVWEEPDCGWKRPVSEYIDLLGETYKQAKRANPYCKIIGGNPGRLTQGIGNLQLYLENGLAKCCDIIGIHPYVAPRSPEDAKWDAEFEKLNHLIGKFGKKEIWATEVGWSTGKGGCSVTEKQQADYLVRMYLLGLATPNLKRIFWFCGSPYGVEDRWGIIEKDKNEFLHPKPALIAFAALTSLLEGFRFEKKVFPRDITTERTRCYFFKRGTEKIVAVWRTGIQTTLKVAAFKVKAVSDIYGNNLNIPAVENGEMVFSIGESPLYICIGENENGAELTDKFQKAVIARTKCENLCPLVMTLSPATCGLNKLKYLSFNIFNQSPEKKNAEIKLMHVPSQWAFSTNGIPFSLNEEEAKTFRFYIKSCPGRPFNEYWFRFKKAIPADKYSSEEELPLDFQVCKYTDRPMKIDACLDDWKNFYPVHIGCRQDQRTFLKGWYGKTDLSGTAYAAWDEKNFYFACKVTDDVFYNSKGIIYARDSIQIAFDTMKNARRSGYDEDDFEFTLGKGVERDEVLCCWQGKKAGAREFLTEKNSGIKFKTKLIENMAPRPQEIIYEIAIPFKFLGFKPEPGKKIGFDIVIMDNDNVFKGGAEYKGGIIGSKDPTKFSEWTFIKE